MRPWMALYGIGMMGVLLGSLRPRVASAADLAIIVNSENDVQTISNDKLKSYFLKMDHYWTGDVPVTPVHRNEGSAAYELFLARIVAQSPSDALSYWIGRKQTDGSSAPMQVPNDRLVIHLVASVKGAVGYVDAANVTDQTPGIRVIRTIKE